MRLWTANGTIEARRKQDIVLERVTRADSPPIWLFSRDTLEAIPALHDEIVVSASNRLLPSFLINTHIGKKPITVAELVEKSGAKAVLVRNHVQTLLRKELVVRTDDGIRQK